MRKILSTYLLSLSILFANGDALLEDDFLASLDEVSEIATKTKLNIDDTPSFVTVLHSDKLKKLGVTNVFEALGLVPSVELKREISGVPIVVFRGTTQKGEVKLMIDGVTVNNAYRGSIYYYLDFPIEMVKRIEVIRGTGSILYGSNAISGVVNIITNNSQKDSKNNIFISKGTFDNHKIGTLLSTNINDIKISIDSYFQKNDKTIFIKENPSGMSGDSDRHLKDYSVGVNISDEHFSLLGRIKKSDIGNAYGILSVLDSEREKNNNINTSIFSQFSYKNNLNKKNKIVLLAGYNKYMQEVQAVHPSVGTIDADYKEETYFYEINLISNSIENNELLIGAKFESVKTLKSEWQIGSKQITPVSKPDLSRKVSSLYLNDNYSSSANLDISAGFRYEHYSDFGNSFVPNLGLVYRYNEQIRIKALYSHAFRAPSWVELTSNEELQAEKAESFETGIIYKKDPQNTLRVNFYVSEITNMINKEGKVYIQKGEIEIYGAEFEYMYYPNYQLELSFFTSFIKAQDDLDSYSNIPDVANIMASTSLVYKLDSGITLGSLLKYVADSYRSQTDTREKIKDSLIFNQTISYSYKNFTTSLVFNDLFDAQTYYPLPPNIYEQDFHDEGRTFMLNASLEF